MARPDPRGIGGAPPVRIRQANALPVRSDRDCVLYWMIAARRTNWNFALDRALAWALALDKPLLILEALRAGYPWASDRLHRFVLDGMHDNAELTARTGVTYYPFVENSKGAGKGLLDALAQHACVVLTDEFPCFFLPQMVAAAARKIDAPLEVVDSNGLLPLAATTRDFTAAAHFRRYVQKELPLHLADFPARNPLGRRHPTAKYRVPDQIAKRWPPVSRQLLGGDEAFLASLPIDHDVPVSAIPGGSRAGRKALRRFVRTKLASYANTRNEPSGGGTSRLSPYLHFGHVSAHEGLRHRNAQGGVVSRGCAASGKRSAERMVGGK